jgi:hypothetical protein
MQAFDMETDQPDTFVAEQLGPPHRRYWIVRDPPVTSNTQTRGWAFVYDEMDSDGQWQPGWDTWEEWFFEILRYPEEHSSEALAWRRKASGEVVDLPSLQSCFDGKSVAQDDTPTTASLLAPR